MQSFNQSEHTILINLSVCLGLGGGYRGEGSDEDLEPRLLNNDFHVKSIGFNIPLRELGANIAVVPDTGFSSKAQNSVLFIECKGGGISSDGDAEQFKKFAFVQNTPDTIVRRSNNFDVKINGLTVDFAILCSDINLVKKEYEKGNIKFPLLVYDKKRQCVIREKIDGTEFKNNKLDGVFEKEISVKRIPKFIYPFGPYDAKKNLTFILKNLFLMVIQKHANLNDYERMPTLDKLLVERFPVLTLVDKKEFEELVKVSEKALRSVFADVDPKSNLNISKYIQMKGGKLIIRRTTIKTFLDKIEETLDALEREGIKQAKLNQAKGDQFEMMEGALAGVNWEIVFPSANT